jgi:SAM-dependent methyltransferase
VSDTGIRDRRELLERMEGTHFWAVGRDELTTNLVTRYDMGGPFLDAGAGTGAYAQTLRDRGHEVFWFDIDEVDPPGFRASLVAIPMRDASVATVLVRDVLEHVDDTASLLEIHRVLTPGGFLLVSVPAWPSLWGPRDELAGHLRRYTRRTLSMVVREAGFIIEEMRGYQFLLLPLVALSRMLSRNSEAGLPREERVGGWANRLLTRINLMEARLARSGHLRPPTGSSLIVVARRP